jgi:citrate lyase subunit beta-like protein
MWATKRLFSTNARKIIPRRSFLYMQGNDQKKLLKASGLGADCVCLDMEDGVAFNRKVEARHGIHNALGNVDFGSSEVCVRINPVSSNLEQDDLDAALTGKIAPHSICLPKTEHADHVRWLDSNISKYGDFSDQVNIFVMIENPVGLLNMKEILRASERIVAVIFGADDYAAAAGAVRTSSNHEVLFARSWIATHAAAFNVQAIDLVNINLDWENGAAELLEAESRIGFELGYSGKQVIHPKQIAVVNRAFSPSEKSIEYAEKLVQAHLNHQASGKGAFVFEGKMIDMVSDLYFLTIFYLFI